MKILNEHRGLIILLALAAVLFTSDIWAWKEFVRAESYFGLGARLMVEQGTWLAPHAPDEQPLNKPPLTYWLIGICYQLFGTSYGSARLPSVFAALSVLALVYWIAARFYGARVGLLSGAVLASSALFMSFARMAMSDMLLTLSVTAFMACYIVASTATRGKWFSFLGFTALGFGILIKGPAVVAISGITILTESIISRQFPPLTRRGAVPALTILLAITVPYFLFVYLRLGPGPLRFFFLTENLQRFTGHVYGDLARPFWYELAAFFGDFGPWSLLIPVAVFVDYYQRRDRPSPDPLCRLCYIWLATTVLLFTLSSFKRDYYLLPAMPAAALILGRIVGNSERLRGKPGLAVKGLLALICLLIVITAVLSLRLAAELQIVSWLRYLPVATSLLGAILVSSYLMKGRVAAATLVVCALIAATFLGLQLVLLPAFVRYLPTQQLVAGVPLDRRWYTAYSTDDWANDVAFNLGTPHQVERLVKDKNNQRLLDLLRSEPSVVAIIRKRDYEWLRQSDPTLKIWAQAETYGRKGVTWAMLRQPQREQLFVVGH